MAFMALSGAAHADVVTDITAAATDAFARMPQVVIVDQIAGQCGADEAVDARVA
jgi:hypothetical protein